MFVKPQQSVKMVIKKISPDQKEFLRVEYKSLRPGWQYKARKFPADESS